MNEREPELPAPEAVRAQLERMLASPVFAGSARQLRFLRYIVEERLAGREERLKGYTIGIEVFDRAPDFDPALDSIVRVEAGRLRAKLREYYEEHGRLDPVRIELPKGSYAVRFSAAGVPPPAPRAQPGHAVAVLPFASLSDARDDGHFADGMTDAVINRLARNPLLGVTSYTSVMRFKGATRALGEIAAALGVDRVVEGTVTHAGGRVRVSVQLIDARSDRHLWAQSYDHPADDVLAVQEAVAIEVSRALGAAVLAEARHHRVNPEAYEATLLGRHYRMQLTEETLDKGIAYYRRAVEIEPAYAEAYAGLAACYCSLGSLGIERRPPHDVLPQGIASAQRALELDPDDVEAHAFLGIMLLKYAWDWDGARREFERALALAPNDCRALLQFSLYHESLGEHARALELAAEAARLDPLSKPVLMNLGWQCHQAGESAAARARLERLTGLEPGFWGGWWALGHVEREAGAHARAIDCFGRAVATGSGGTLPLEGLGHACGVAGDAAGAREVLARLTAAAQAGYVSPYRIATVHAGLGAADATFEWLERALAMRSRSLAWLAVALEYRPYRDDPRFVALVERIGIPL